MGDLTISNLSVGENESGLLHWAEADFTQGRKKVRVRAHFIDMPMFDEKGGLRMDGVGDLLRQAYEETLRPHVPEPAYVQEPMEEIPYEETEIETPAALIKARREKLAALAASCEAARPAKLYIDGEAV